MNVLYVDLEREWRGGQSQALLTLRGLRESGHVAELVAARGSPIARRAAVAGIIVHEVSRVALRLSAARVVRRLARSGRFNVLHANESHALTAAWMAGADAFLPILLSRRIGFPLQSNIFSRARFRAVCRFVATCQDIARSLMESGISSERIAIVNEGVEIPPLPSAGSRLRARKYWGVKEDEFLFGCVGVFVPEKGQRHLIEALAKVRKEYPRARLLLAGDGACRPALEKLTNDLGQTEAVHLVGFVQDVTPVYMALDAFLFPSEFEGLGTSMLAALAWGLPSVSTARAGLAEVVDNGRTGLVAEPDGRQFAEAMLRLLREPSFAQRLGVAARRSAIERFSAAQMVEGTLSVYREALRRRPGSSR